MKKASLLTLFLLVAMLILAACGQGADNGAATDEKDSFTFVSFMTTETLDPTSGIDIDKPVAHAIYDTLVCFAPDASIEPMLAESWTESDDGMSVTFNLRHGVKFHNGEEMTADDVIYTFDTMLEKPQYFKLVDYIKSYEKIDDYTVRFEKTAPYVKIFNVMAEHSYIVCKSAHEADPASYEVTPIGTGPYTFDSFDVDDSVKLKAFEDYWGEPAAFEYAIVKPYMDPATCVVALETGEIDMALWLPVAQTALVESNPDLTLVTEENSWSVNSLLLMGDILNNDINLRRAIFHGINPENAIKLGNDGKGVPSKNLFADRVMGDYAGIIDFVGYDEQLARECLSQSNYKGEDIYLAFYDGVNIAESIQADLKALGINIKLEQLSANDWSTKVYGGEVDIAMAEFGGNMWSVEDGMTLYSQRNASYGVHMAKNDEYEALLDAIAAETDADARRDLVKQAQQTLYDMATMVPLFGATFNYAYGPNIKYDYTCSAPTYVFYLGKVTRP